MRVYYMEAGLLRAVHLEKAEVGKCHSLKIYDPVRKGKAHSRVRHVFDDANKY